MVFLLLLDDIHDKEYLKKNMAGTEILDVEQDLSNWKLEIKICVKGEVQIWTKCMQMNC